MSDREQEADTYKVTFSLVIMLGMSISLGWTDESFAKSGGIDLGSFGAVGDGIADDTAAIERWLNSLQEGKVASAPAGTFRFTRPLYISHDAITIRGAGLYQTVFMFAGESTTGDLITVGREDRVSKNLVLSDFRIMSKTKLKGGAALRLHNLGRSNLYNIVVDGQDGNGNLWNGIWFDGADFLVFKGFEARAQQDAIRICGAVGRGPKADLMMSDGKISGSRVGLRIGGAFGGLFVDQVDIIGNEQDVVIDTTLVAEGNREIFFGPTVAIDSPTRGAAVSVIDSLANREAFLQFSGTWLASGVASGIVINPSTNWIVAFQGGTIFNFRKDGIENFSTSSRLFINGTIIRHNEGFGLKSIQRKDVNINAYFIENGHGAFNKVE